MRWCPRFASFLWTLTWVCVLTGCGYHTSGHAVRLPSDVHSIYVQAFANGTDIYGIGQKITQDVVREMRSRTNYRIEIEPNGNADAVLSGTVTYSSIAPLTYDAATGRISSAMVILGMKASLVTPTGKVLWENSNFFYREQYQVSRDVASFFEEEEPALTRVSRDFAQTLVSEILEAY